MPPRPAAVPQPPPRRRVATNPPPGFVVEESARLPAVLAEVDAPEAIARREIERAERDRVAAAAAAAHQAALNDTLDPVAARRAARLAQREEV